MADIREILIQSQISRVDRSKLSGAQGSQKPAPVKGEKFEAALDTAELRISKHALKRLDSRNIELNDMDRLKLTGALDSLERKGARDSLVLMGENAFVVNVPSKTVVTALSKDQMKDHVFTNIDSTILVES